MRLYSKAFEESKADRIAKAINIINSGGMIDIGEGLWSVPGSGKKQYVVSALACQCKDYQYNGGVPCKHQWASVGAKAAKVIWERRFASTKFDLDRATQEAAEALIGVPEPFLAVIRATFRERAAVIDRLRKAFREEVKIGFRFKSGRVVMTPGAMDLLASYGKLVWEFVARHLMGDWGDLTHEDKRANEDALVSGARVFSAYLLKTGEKIWVITEASRESTTVLLPSEY